MAGSGLVIGPGAKVGKLGGGGKAHSLCPPCGKGVGAHGWGWSWWKVGQVPALCSAGAGASLRWAGQRGKGAVQFHFLHLLFTHCLGWGTMVYFGVLWCTLAAHLRPALGLPCLLRMHEGASCQGGRDRALPSCSHIGCRGRDGLSTRVPEPHKI